MKWGKRTHICLSLYEKQEKKRSKLKVTHRRKETVAVKFDFPPRGREVRGRTGCDVIYSVDQRYTKQVPDAIGVVPPPGHTLLWRYVLLNQQAQLEQVQHCLHNNTEQQDLNDSQ